MKLEVNGNEVEITSEADTPLLWVLRDELGLVGTKYGCGIAQCGACTVHLEGRAIRSCVTPVSAVAGKRIQTIEGQASDQGLSPVQQAWLETDVAQCGYCQSGQIMAATALLSSNPSPNDADIDAAMAGNICRCGTYPRIRKAVHLAATLMSEEQGA
ncbi:MAG: (2Fe-2S)-binding protein [Luminiphilus sp.]|jgi:aerobic-type carbon monoxide dehydrogenase small subunit (CoxS/CutS family)|nr:(2Fe-2S)-binding protein [Luminiphilus sp.]